MMYEPKQTEIDDKVQELLLVKITELDSFKQPMLGEAIGNDNGALISVLIEFAKASSIDDKLICHEKFIDALKKYFSLEVEAEKSLIAERGYTVQTAVDDFEFIPHDTRY